MNSFPDLDGQSEFGPTFELEYSARDTYGATIEWGVNDPLNATWWHRVTEGRCDALCVQGLFLSRHIAMEANSTLVQVSSP